MLFTQCWVPSVKKIAYDKRFDFTNNEWDSYRSVHLKSDSNLVQELSISEKGQMECMQELVCATQT